jgi:hypothetical protein
MHYHQPLDCRGPSPTPPGGEGVLDCRTHTSEVGFSTHSSTAFCDEELPRCLAQSFAAARLAQSLIVVLPRVNWSKPVPTSPTVLASRFCTVRNTARFLGFVAFGDEA